MARDVELEAEEWYVLCNWLCTWENRLLYALRDRSREWEFVHELRRSIREQRTDGPSETSGLVQSIALTNDQFDYLDTFLQARARRLRVRPWRDRERRDVIHLRRKLLEVA